MYWDRQVDYFFDMAVFKKLCILVVYQFKGDTVTGDVFVSTIFWDRQERRGAGYRSIPEVLQYSSTCHRSILAHTHSIWNFTVENLIQIRGEEPAPLFENNTDIKHHTSKSSLDTVYLTGTELAHQARAAVVRGIS
jgi:hypothetical protein